MEELLSSRLRPEPDLETRKRKFHKSQVFFRTKAQRVGVELDNALRGPGEHGGGLRQFQLAEAWESEEDLLAKKVLVVASDQGPDMWCFQNWADSKYGRLCCARDPDVWNHGLMNDSVSAAIECGAGSFLFAVTVVMNLHFLPYKEGRYGRMIERMATELREKHDRSETCFQFFLRDIAREKGLAHELSKGPDAEQCIWEAFLSSPTFWSYQQKIAMCRWGQVFNRLHAFQKDWSSFLALLTRLCVDEKFMETAHFRQMLQDLSASGLAQDGGSKFEQSIRGSSAEEIKQLRALCRNSMCFAFHFLNGPKHKATGAILGLLSRESWKHYTEQASSLVSGSLGEVWAREQLKGRFWEPLRKTLHFLRSATFFEQLEIPTNRATHAATSCPVDERDKIRLACEFAFAMVRRRYTRCAFFLTGWPYRGLLWLDQDADIRNGALAEFKEQVAAYAEAQKKNSTFYQTMCERSPLRLPVVRMFSQALEKNAWVLTPAIVEKMTKICQSFRQSRLVERAFNVGRRAESKTGNKEMSEISFMWSLLSKNVLDETFKYTTIDAATLPQQHGAELSDSAFRGLARDCSVDCSSIRSTSRVAPWYSPSPLNWARGFWEALFLQHVHARSAWTIAEEQAWQVSFFPQGEPLLVAADGASQESTYYLLLGHTDASLLVWPIKLRGWRGQDRLYAICKPKSPGQLPCCKPGLALCRARRSAASTAARAHAAPA